MSLGRLVLVIVDEAHRGLQDENSPVYDNLLPIADGTRLLLVTATPFQLSTKGFLNMLELASSATAERRREHIGGYGQAMVRLLSKCRAYQEAETESDGRTGDEPIKTALDEVKRLHQDAKAALEAHMLDPYPRDEMGVPAMPELCKTEIEPKPERWERGYQVARIVPELVKNPGDMFQRRLLSCNAAFWRGAAGKALRKEAGANASIMNFVKELDRYLGAGGLESAEADTTDAQAELRHPKVAMTTAWVSERIQEGRHVLVFCTFKETQQVLVEVLCKKLGAGSVVALDHAGQLRDDIRTRFSDPRATPMALVVRDNLSESIDLDGGRPCLVHHDLTWNPARMEQRWGRVVRLSSGFSPVKPADIYCPVLALESDLRMYDTVSHRHAMVNLILPGGTEEDWAVLPAWVLLELRS